jgi:hypothetical protein
MCSYCAASAIVNNSDKDPNTTEAVIYLSVLFFVIFISYHCKNYLGGKYFRNPSTLDQLEEWAKKRDTARP